MIKSLFATLALMLFASAAWAHTCPALMSEIDQALEDDAIVAQLSEDELAEVRELRERGEAYHIEGEHDQSEETLNEVKDMLGIA
ncbi:MULTISPECIES: hypothetical protein [Halomonadaceae]|uniref:hypothetical protein n=1 Tax=Halomonadaceae TaxID=28256 RepID=UPI001599FEFF|nr:MULTISPECIES: hypothetical protein [Halomonas]QJQ95919.1 hypothetical protein HIO72_12005 [Halomonas sp. PA5]